MEGGGGGIGLMPKMQQRFSVVDGKKVGERDFEKERKQQEMRQMEEEEERRFVERQRRAIDDMHFSNMIQLCDIHDGHLRRVYAFAQSIAGSLGAYSQKQMEMIWAGEIPGKKASMSASQAKCSKQTLSDEQVELLKREIEESVVKRLSFVPTTAATIPRVEEIEQQRIAEERQRMETATMSVDGSGGGGGASLLFRTPEEEGRGKELVSAATSQARRQFEERFACNGEELLRQALLTPSEVTRPWLEAWKLASGYADDPRERFEAVKTVWVGIVHDMAMQNFTPYAKSAIETSMDNIHDIAGRHDLTATDLILSPGAARVFSRLVARNLHRILHENSGAGAQQWRAGQLATEIVLLAKRFRDLQIDRGSERAYFTQRPSSQTTLRRRYLTNGRVQRVKNRMRSFVESYDPEPSFISSSAELFMDPVTFAASYSSSSSSSQTSAGRRRGSVRAAAAAAASLIQGSIEEYQDTSQTQSMLMEAMFPSSHYSASSYRPVNAFVSPMSVEYRS